MVTYATVGHSGRDLDEFLGMLADAGVDVAVDVRRLPGSGRYPWFDQDALRESLRERGIAYHHEPALTGRRPCAPTSTTP